MHYWQQVLRRRRWRMILFHMFWIMFLIQSMPVTFFLLEWSNQDIWGLGLGLGVINMMEFY
ncbi:hypothetical protein AXB88_01670 [Salmonella enterica]|uniref:Uncharacterized protein n=2 Tax=Salmonella enterica TaxID=28901 RepID=A0A622M163_SALET|nr:hypothetical protein [Salmonella enterica]EAZ4644083.1 hypothetical protein [Salmonella enterica subsp. enterica serovar Weltevreden]EBF8299270.1 hypothetical protein [Salmonella enterica subsp. enterica serovar Mbandaka]EBF8496457.1 hypothetical protein [Salmonella enterica subsp. enterica serovar Bovismorbificans]EBG2358569.1 hypothetical protein [Salmonella enterica subsp. enterica serovar Wien]EBG8221331.1 hypothetical protein [Salmonella enterica subsp. enterica]EDB6681691.1 hypotheti